VSKPAGLLAMPDISLVSPSSIEISGQMNSTTLVGNRTLVSLRVELDPLLASHSGSYTCEVSVMSPSLLVPLNFTSITRVSVQSKLNPHS
jgi:hypothetical protein